MYYAEVGITQIGGSFAQISPMAGDDVLRDDSLQTQYTFSPESRLEYRLGRYSLDGQFLGLTTAQNGRIQLCTDTTDKLDAAFIFGTTYSQSVSISIRPRKSNTFFRYPDRARPNIFLEKLSIEKF